MASSAVTLTDKPKRVQQLGAGSVNAFATHLPLGVIWVICGVCSYGLLSLASRCLLHSEQAAWHWRAQVPIVVYDRSLFMFATAFLIDILTMCFEYKSSRLDMVLLPAFIKGMATLTNTVVRYGWGAIGQGPGDSMVMVQRYICWMHTTPTILLLIRMISTSITKQQVVRAIMCVEVMLITGLAGALCSGWLSVFWGMASHLAFLPLLPYLHQGLTEAGCIVSLHAAGHTMTLVYYITMMMWVTFGLVWDLRMLGFLSADVEEVVYLCCDFSAKVMFSSGLMLSSFKGMENRREGVMRQIQETHRQTLIQELKRVIEQKDAFMSSVSHELRTPLNGIIGISEGLLSGCCGILNESVRRQVYIVRTSGARLLALINDVMDAAALRQHRLVLKQELLDLRQIVGDVSDLTRSLVDNDVTLRNDVPEGMAVWADTGRMIQILNNLLGNAAKFTHQGSIRVSASWYDEQHQWAAIHVTDTGIGIPKQKLASIFLPFEQVDGSISRQYGGFGLGLSITQELVKAHGGELWVKSREGKGSSFTFTLPSFTGQIQQPAHQAGATIITPGIRANSLVAASAARASDQDHVTSADVKAMHGDPAAEYASCASEEYTSELPYDAAQLSALASSKPFTASSAAAAAASSSNSQSVAKAPAGSTAVGPAPGKRDVRPTQFIRTGRYQILSVDDDQVNQTVVQSLLSSTGYEVVTLSSGRQMLDYLDDCEVLPDLILLDVMMPDMSGPEVCAQLAKRPKTLPVPIIMVSAHTDEAVVVKGLDSGADDYITKPFRREEFLARIRAKLQLSNGVVVEQALAGQHADEGNPVVMCVDDDEVNHIVLEGMVQSQNYRYLKARSGAEAMQLLDQSGGRPPHLVLLDASLPDTTGLDVLQQLRSRYSQVALPVVMLTARHNERAIVEALDTGANDYAVKPFRRSELLARIRMHLRSSQRAAAAAAAEPADVGPVAAALAQADQDLSAVLQQLVPAAEQLKTMPLLVAQLSGLEEASAGLSPEQLSGLLGNIADTFDATVEKYAMLKVDATDNCLTVAAPLTSSTNNSARSSLQKDQQVPGSAQQLQQPATRDATAAGQVTPSAAMLQQLLKLARELWTVLGVSEAHLENQVAEQQAAGMTSSSASSSSVQARLPDCYKGVLQLRVALHVGGLHAGVVGVRRPRYRLLGPALHLVKQAAAAAPANSIVATGAAASQLAVLGTQLMPLATPDGASGGVDDGSDTKQLFLVGTGPVGSCCNISQVSGPIDPGGMPPEVAGQCWAPRQQRLPQVWPYLPVPAESPQHAKAQQQQLELAQLPSLQQQTMWAPLLLKQQQQLMALTAQLAAANGLSGSTSAQANGVGLGLSSWLIGMAAPGGLSATTAAMALAPHTAAEGQAPGDDSHSSAPRSMDNKAAARSVSDGSSASAAAQPLHQQWWGPLVGSMPADGGTWWNGQGGTAAEVEFAAALGALAGWQLGPTEAQQILMIQQELDQVMQQLAGVTNGCMSFQPSPGCGLNGSCPPCPVNTWQVGQGAGSPGVCSAQREQVVPAALTAAAGNRPFDTARPGDEQYQRLSRSSSCSGQLSPPASGESDCCRVSRGSSYIINQMRVGQLGWPTDSPRQRSS